MEVAEGMGQPVILEAKVTSTGLLLTAVLPEDCC
jgi:hypothetical protein